MKRYFVASVFLHVLFIGFLLFHMSAPTPPPIVNKGSKIIHAVAIENTQVEAIEKQIKNEQVQQQKQIDDQIKARKAAEQKKIDDAKALEELKAQQAAEQKRVEKLKQEQAIADEKLKKIKEEEAIEAENLKKQKLEKEKLEKAKLEKEKLKKEQEQKKQAEKNAAALKLKQRKQNEAAIALQKSIAAKQAAIAQQRSEAINGVVDQYTGLILEAISQNWLVPPGTNPKLSCQLYISLSTGGKVSSVKLIKGSGNALLDQSAVAAVYKASPLPMPADADAAAQFKQFSLTLTPEQVIEA